MAFDYMRFPQICDGVFGFCFVARRVGQGFIIFLIGFVFYVRVGFWVGVGCGVWRGVMVSMRFM